jgi:tRNA G18 (ribose-2'-O)-methylase SpoU
MHIIPITELNDPRLEPYRHLTKFNHTQLSGIFIAEGWRVVWRLLQSNLRTNSVLISERRWPELEPSLRELGIWDKHDCPIYVVPQDMGEDLVGFNFHTGVLACADRPHKLNWTQIQQQLETKPQARILVCPRMISPENLGAAIRNAAGLGFDAILLGRGSVDPYCRRVVRVSMGIIFRMPVLLTNHLTDLLAGISPHIWQKFALELTPDAIDLREINKPSHLLLFIGNEAEGLEKKWLDICEHKVYIPMQAEVDSLNAATAAAIAMYQLGE